VLSSLIPSVILGKERSTLIQFLVCLTLAFVAVSFTDIFPYLGENLGEQIFEMVSSATEPLETKEIEGKLKEFSRSMIL